jgi:hypothetical protein
MKLKIINTTVVIVAAILLAACSDRVEQEPLPIEEQHIDSQNPALYQQYLENLRNYKKSYHQIVIGWFDNSNKSFRSRAEHLEAVPDKVDIVALMYGDNLTEAERAEMQAIRVNKGTRVIYTIDYEAFRQSVESRNNEISAQNAAKAEDPEYVLIPLLVLTDELPTFLDAQLALLDNYGYDGFSIYYNGKSSAGFISETDRAELQAIQNILTSKINAVINAHQNKVFLFEGTPANILDKSFLQAFNYIVLRTYSIQSILDLTSSVKSSLVAGVPADRIVVCAAPFFTDEFDASYGNIIATDNTSQPAITEIAHWMKIPDSYTKSGLGIYWINYDYYNPDTDYKYTREAIEIMNPSPKN